MTRFAAQYLAGPAAAGVPDVAGRVVGVQAQSMPAACLAVRARTSGLTAADVEAALAAGDLVRTWLMRGTLHLVTAADAGWLTALFAPGELRAGRGRRLRLGLSDDICARALTEIPSLLPAPMPRAALIAALAGRGVRIDPAGQAPAHLVKYAALCGLLSCGPGTTVVPLPAAPGPGPSGGAALEELCRRFQVGYGPATADDCAAWSGLPVGALRRVFPASGPAGPGAPPPPRLLGPFDPMLLGYAGRSFLLDPAHAGRVNAGGGMIAATVLVGGKVAGTWRRAGRTVTVTPFAGAFPDDVRAALDAEAGDVRRFLGLA